MTEAKPLTAEEFGGDFESECAYLRSCVERLRTTIEARDQEIVKLQTDFDILLDDSLHINDLLRLHVDHATFEGSMNDVECFRSLVNNMFAKYRLRAKEQSK